MKGFNNWISTQDGDFKERDLRKIWDVTASYKDKYSPNIDKGHDMFMDKIRLEKTASTKVITLSHRNKFFRVAAAVAILLVAAVLLKQFTGPSTEPNLEIAEAKNTLQELNLADGTLVSLNTLSSLEYPVHFAENSRAVKLQGEAFFDVARDESKPFLIETEKATIEVLGTSFNVRSFPNENLLEVFVKSGKVAVNVLGEDKTHILTKGELLKVDFSENEIKRISEKTDNSLAWKTGKLIFVEKPMGEVFEALEKLHNINFELQEESLNTCAFTINFGSTNLEDVFNGLEVACDLSFSKKSGSTYLVEGSCCK